MKGFAAWLKDKLLDLRDDLKRIYKSWTVWFNVVGLPLLVAYWPQIWDALPQLATVLSEDKYKALFTIGSIVNVLLRFKTSKALRDK